MVHLPVSSLTSSAYSLAGPALWALRVAAAAPRPRSGGRRSPTSTRRCRLAGDCSRGQPGRRLPGKAEKLLASLDDGIRLQSGYLSHNAITVDSHRLSTKRHNPPQPRASRPAPSAPCVLRHPTRPENRRSSRHLKTRASRWRSGELPSQDAALIRNAELVRAAPDRWLRPTRVPALARGAMLAIQVTPWPL